MIRDDATVGDRLQAMTVQTESPDGKIWARVHDYTQLTVGFYPFTYEQYDEPGLSYQLSRLGILTWVAWSGERTDITVARLISAPTEPKARNGPTTPSGGSMTPKSTPSRPKGSRPTAHCESAPSA